MVARDQRLSSPLAAFERLWTDVRSETVDDVWLNAYRARVADQPPFSSQPAAPDFTALAAAEVADEALVVPPTPWPIQLEALQALEATRGTDTKPASSS